MDRFILKIIIDHYLFTGHVQTPSKRAPQESSALRDRGTCTPTNPPVLYAPNRREICEGQSMSVLGRQSYL